METKAVLYAAFAKRLNIGRVVQHGKRPGGSGGSLREPPKPKKPLESTGAWMVLRVLGWLHGGC
jgi:hypothetical protein